MVQKRHVIITDDLDGSEGARTYAFSWQQGRYEIDLSDERRDERRGRARTAPMCVRGHVPTATM